MLLTKNLLFRIIIIGVLLLSAGKAVSQEEVSIDTSDYLPLYVKGALDNNLMVAASKGFDSEIERLLLEGADINAESSEGATPLVFAVANNHLSSVLILLTHNPEVNKMTSNNETPLIIAVRNRNAEIAEILIRGGAEVDRSDGNGATPIHYATLEGSFNLVDILLYYDARSDLKANDGTTPLMAAIWSGYIDITDLLVQNGANLESRDNEGFTPFLIAAQNGDTLTMSLLLKDGVNLYEKNNYNYNALALAIETNQKVAVEFLLEKGDKWTSSENEGVNPYRVASAFGRKDITEILEKNNIKGREGLKIDEISVLASIKYNFRDYFTGLALSFKEPLLNAGFIAGCDFKPSYTRVLTKEGENTYYQYFDKSSIVFAGIFKDFTVSENSSSLKISLSTSLSAGYSFGSKFKGTNINPESKFRIIPAAGIKLQKKYFTIKADLEYTNTDFFRIGPIWMRIGIAYNNFLNKVRSPRKTIKWF